MVWDPTKPATNADLLSAPVRDNFAALHTQVVSPLVTLAPNLVLMVGASDQLAGVPASTNGFVLTLVGGVPLWQAAAFLNPMTTIGDMIVGGGSGTPNRLAAAGSNGFVLTLAGGVPGWAGIPAQPTTFPLLAPDGAVTAPSYSFASQPAHGMCIGPGGHLYLVSAGGSALLVFNRGATTSWYIDGTHGWQPGVDATTDIGAAATRVRDLWLSRDVDFTSLASAPATPATGHVVLYSKTDKKLYAKDDAGLETPLGGGSGGANVVRLPLEQATLPDGTGTINNPPEMGREVTVGTQTTNTPKATRTVANFDQSVDEHLQWAFMLPSNYVSGGTIRLKWKAYAATTGNVVWKAGAVATVDGSSDDDASVFTAADLAAASPAPAVQGQSVEVTIALTTTGFAANRRVTVFVGRDADNAADTMAGSGFLGDAVLMGVQFEYAA